MSINPTAAKVITLAESQVGYREGRSSNGTWNNDQKYSDELPGFKWSDFQPWCATFLCWLFWKLDIYKLIPTPSASCDVLANGFKNASQWHTAPAIGDFGFLGTARDYFHVFLVTKVDGLYVETIEGNTNDNGSANGDGVYRRRRLISSIGGFGRPAYPKPPLSQDPDLVAADRALQHARNKRKPSPIRKAIVEALRAVRTARKVK